MIGKTNGTPRRRRHRTLGIFAVVVMVGAVSIYTLHALALARSITRELPFVKQSYQQHQWALVIHELADLSSSIRALRAETAWVGVLGVFPGIGPHIHRDEKLLLGLQQVCEAAYDLQPVSTQLASTHSVTRAMQQLRPFALVASARAIAAIAHLPDFPADSGFYSLDELKAQIRPLVSVAALVVHHPQVVSSVLGSRAPERFLLIFQDNGELRSTGGFMAADGLMTLYHGRMEVTFNSDIAKTANAIRLHEPAPWVLRTYFGERYISFINANLNPDVPDSAHLIQKLYDSIPGHARISGVIFLDSWLASRLVGIVGSVSVGGQTFTQANFYPKVEYLAEDRGLGNSTRMQFLGRILQVLEDKVQRPQMLARLWPLLNRALLQKHLMIDIDNPSVQGWLSRRHWTGALPVAQHENSLLVLNDNYGGLKDNHFMKSGVGIALRKLSNGRDEETVTTTWTLSGIRNGWLVGTYVGWVQCFVPKGTKLLALYGYHVHGVRRTIHPQLKMTAFGTGILIAPRPNANTPPHVQSLQWVFLLPRLSHPDKIHLIIQPGLVGQQLEYRGPHGHVRVQQRHDEIVTVD